MVDEVSMRQLPAASYKRLKRAFRDLYRECGGTVAAAQITRVCKTSIHNFGQFDRPEFAPLDVVADLEAECGQPLVTRVLMAMAAEGETPHQPADPLTRLATCAKECGEAMHAYAGVAEVSSPNRVSAARKEVREAREALEAVERDLDAMDAGGLRAVGGGR